MSHEKHEAPIPKPLFWARSSKKDFDGFPIRVKETAGYALYLAQVGKHHIGAKSLKGFGGGAVVELLSDHAGDAFRTVYTVRFEKAVYVLHAFQKKSKSGRATAKTDIELVRARLKDAEEHYRAWLGQEAKRGKADN